MAIIYNYVGTKFRNFDASNALMMHNTCITPSINIHKEECALRLFGLHSPVNLKVSYLVATNL